VNSELRVLLERANARRLSLLGLVEVIPDEYWSKQEDAGSWTAGQHLAHAATADELLLETVSGAREARYENLRAVLLSDAEGEPLHALLARMERDRARIAAWLDGLSHDWLESMIELAGLQDSWGRPVSWPVRALLSAWSEHDTGHELAIRRAITAPPDATALSAAAPRRTR
jgi:uncharacterized damage-inducible protein DinB